MSNNKHIIVYEHDTVKIGERENELTPSEFKALERFYGNGVPYFNLVYKGIKFCDFVGALQVGQTKISVLPKTDRSNAKDNAVWQKVLIDMLRAVHGFDVHAPSSSALKLKNNTVLDLYFELFISEVEYLLHKGLVKKYRKTEGNVLSLKGNLKFSKQISQNLIHAERFYTAHSTYDTQHILHCILFETIHVVKQLTNNINLTSRLNLLLFNFPEMPRMRITEQHFDKVVLNRKTLGYKKALEIAQLILLRYHPDLSNGRKNVLALMFGMNDLWEQFVLQSLRKLKGDYKIHGQRIKYFWKPEGGSRRSIRPDITIQKGTANYVLDTKWKVVRNKPSIEDIRQMYAYHHYLEATKVALLYPGNAEDVKGNFVDIKEQNKLVELECSLLFTEFNDSVKNWQLEICNHVQEWINNN